MLAQSLSFPAQPDESVRGLLVRLAQNNLCSSGQMCEWLGLHGINKDIDVDPAPAAKIVGIAPDVFAAMGFSRDAMEPMLGNQVPRQMVDRHVMRVCPRCLAEAPYHRRIWDHQQIQVCPIHRVRLLHRCPECEVGGRIRWGRWAMLAGDCGHDLSHQPAQPAGNCNGAAAVYKSCGLTCEGPEFPAGFRVLPLQPLLDVLFFLGRMDVVVVQGNPDTIQPSEMLTDPRLLEAGASIAFGWPGSFDDLARRVRAVYPENAGLTRQYDHLHRFIMKSGDAPYAALLRGAYADHLASRDDVSDAAWPKWLPRTKSIQAGLSILEAKALLGLGHRSFAALRTQSLWTNLVPLPMATNGTHYRREDILALKARLDRLVPPHALDELLGIGRGKGRQLCDAGLIPFYLWSRHHKRGEERSVDSDDVGILFNEVRRHVLEHRPARPLNFTSVLNRAVAHRVLSFADVMRCLLAGELRGYVAEPERHGFASLLFDEERVICVLDGLAHPSRSGKMCLVDAARYLGVRAQAVHDLVAAQLLPNPTFNGAWIFEAAAVDKLCQQTLTSSLATLEPTSAA